tara:strand:+ start:1955 stop:2281 length:327 start_codon:yes stop_codon:yes gene_type:complete
MEQTYNGWKNWATWNANLWIDNDQPLYENIMDRCQELCYQCTLTSVPYNLSTHIHDTLMTVLDIGDNSGIKEDFIGHTLEEVDTLEIAHHFFQEYIGYEEYKKLYPNK